MTDKLTDAVKLALPTVEQARAIGAKGGEPSESERLLFEAWMRGHCWKVCGTWDGRQYISPTEVNGEVDYHAMHTRQLWAAWRDRASLAQQDAQKKHKPLFAEMIAQHPGLAEELAQQDAQAVDFDDAYASTTMALVEDYAKAVHDGDDAACSVLRQTIQASLAQAAPTPPAQRVMLTDEEISRVYTEQTGADIDASPWALRDFARAVIEAYEKKNGIK